MVWLKGVGPGAGGLGVQCGNAISVGAHRLFNVSPKLDDLQNFPKGTSYKKE